MKASAVVFVFVLLVAVCSAKSLRGHRHTKKSESVEKAQYGCDCQVCRPTCPVSCGCPKVEPHYVQTLVTRPRYQSNCDCTAYMPHPSCGCTPPPPACDCQTPHVAPQCAHVCPPPAPRYVIMRSPCDCNSGSQMPSHCGCPPPRPSCDCSLPSQSPSCGCHPLQIITFTPQRQSSCDCARPAQHASCGCAPRPWPSCNCHIPNQHSSCGCPQAPVAALAVQFNQPPSCDCQRVHIQPACAPVCPPPAPRYVIRSSCDCAQAAQPSHCGCNQVVHGYSTSDNVPLYAALSEKSARPSLASVKRSLLPVRVSKSKDSKALRVRAHQRAHRLRQ